jgi:hypothetical protein
MKFEDKKAYVYKVLHSCNTLEHIDIVVEWGISVIAYRYCREDLIEKRELINYARYFKKYLLKRDATYEA